MDISVKLLVDELGFEIDVHLPENSNPCFSALELYSPADTDSPRETLLVCALSEILSVPREAGRCFLCVRDRITDKRETREAMDGILLVRQSIGLRALFNRAQRVFARLQNWEACMERSVSAGEGLQALLNLSEPLFRNHIALQDSTFKLLAYTKNVPPPDEVSEKLVRLGYHPPETMELFKRLRRLEEFEQRHDLIISRDRETSPYVVVKQMFRAGGAVTILFVMVCCGREESEGLLELTRLLLHFIKIYVERDSVVFGGSNAVKTLALDLIAGKVGSPEEARIRAAYASFPYEGTFRLFVITFEDAQNIPLSGLIRSLSAEFPQVSVFSYSRDVLILDTERGETTRYQTVIRQVLTGETFRCGISDRFERLWDIGKAHKQATVAVSVAGKLKPQALDQSGGVFCRFKDYWVYHLLSEGLRGSPEIFENSLLLRSVRNIRHYDTEHRTDTLGILRLYLTNERKATAVAALLHMHRNTVLYHIARIETTLGFSLDDADLRLKLELAFRADDFRESERGKDRGD